MQATAAGLDKSESHDKSESRDKSEPGDPAELDTAVAAEPRLDGDPVPRPPAPRSEDAIMATWQSPVPLVSVVCHTYNHARFIRDALNGFLMQQTRFAFEILINDDASTDGTGHIIQEYLSAYPRLIRATLQQDNQFSQGITPRNFTFPRVRGKYIALCEGDDYWISPTKLQEQVDAFAPGVSLVFHDALALADGRIRDSSYYHAGQRPVKGYTPCQMARGCKIPTASVMFVSSPFKKEKHENIVNGDHLIWATLASLGAAKFLPNAYSVYRYHDGGIWSARKVLDKVEPSLRSKRVIFECVDARFKTSAVVGYLGVALTLARQLIEAGDQAAASRLMRSMYGQALKMLPRCRLYDVNNLRDLQLVVRMLALRLPKAWIKMKLN